MLMAALAFGCTASATTDAPAGAPVTVSFSVDDGESVLRVDVNARAGESALAAMKRAMDVKTQDSAMGSFVTSINGMDAGPARYWAL